MQRVASRIEDVTVYAGAARVKRVAEVSEAGEVQLGGLPLALQDASVRLAATGGLVACDARVVLEIAAADDALPPADPAALEAARLAVRGLDAEVARIARSLEALAAGAPPARRESALL
jgi:hypothetical protein